MSKKALEISCVLAIMAAAALVCLPTFVYGAPYGHDTVYHMGYLSDFASELRAGDWYPRWLNDLNGGAGSPAFFFYAPFPFYTAALVDAALCPSCSMSIRIA